MAQILDIGLSIAFSFIGNLLKPRQVDKSPDSLPNPQFGAKLFRGWGTFMCPGMLVYALPPSRNKRVQLDKYNWSNPEEASSYVSFLVANPNNPLLRSIRVNGKIAASNYLALPISAEFKGFRVTDSVTRLERVNDFNFRFLNGTQLTPDSIFVTGGNKDLVYRGQSCLVVDSSLRAIYGGRGSSVSVVMENAITSSTFEGGGIFGSFNESTLLSYTPGAALPLSLIGLFNNANSLGEKQITVPNGFQFTQNLAIFDSATSVQPSNASTGVFVFGTGSQFYLTDSLVALNLTVKQAGLGLTPLGAAGSANRVAYSASLPAVVTNEVIVSRLEGLSRTVIIDVPGSSPFYSELGLIKNIFGQIVGNCGADEKVIGWANTVFTRSAPLNNTTTIPPTARVATTDLKTIFKGLLAESKIKYRFNPGFNENLIGYLTNRSDVSADLSNLMAIFRKFVIQERDGTLVFTTYPAFKPVTSIEAEHHVTPPELSFTPKDELVDAVNFSYRSVEAEFDSRTIRVGGDSDRVTDYTVEITATSQQAHVFAKRLRNYQLSQTLTGTLHLHPVANVMSPGDTYVLKALTPGGLDIPVIILRVETGVDSTVKAEFIIWVPDVPVVFTNELAAGTASRPLLEGTKIFVVDTEARSPRVGLTYYTESSNDAIFNNNRVSPNSTNFAGRVIAAGRTNTQFSVYAPKQVPVINRDYYVFNLATGVGSWIFITAVTLTVLDTYVVSFTSGKYDSNPFSAIVAAPDLLMLELAEQNTVEDEYVGNEFIQNAQIVSWPFVTRKRTKEPELVSIINVRNSFANVFNIEFVRASSVPGLNGSGTVPRALTTAYFNVRNVSTNTTVFVTSDSFDNTVRLVHAAGEFIEIIQVKINGTPIPGAFVNSFTAV
jgi:hypothetical protein